MLSLVSDLAALGLNLLAVLGLWAFQALCWRSIITPPWKAYGNSMLPAEGLQPVSLSARSAWRWRSSGWWTFAALSLFLLQDSASGQHALGDAGGTLDVLLAAAGVFGFLALGMTGLVLLISFTDDGQPSCHEHRVLLRPQLALDGQLECQCPADGCERRVSGNPFRKTPSEEPPPPEEPS
jgi:hypothetical protein